MTDHATHQQNKGHGHVVPRPDGVKARCGGPAFCKVCQQEQQALNAPAHQQTSEVLISTRCDKAEDGSYTATVRVSGLASEEQAKGDVSRMRNALSQPELPALPEPHLLSSESDDGLHHYTSDQMRAYARAAVLADRTARLSGDVPAPTHWWVRNETIGQNDISTHGPNAAYYGSDWREVMPLYTVDEMRAAIAAAHAARRAAQAECEALKSRIASARLDIQRELRQQGWVSHQELERRENPRQLIERWKGDDKIESPFNACMHRGYCLGLKEELRRSGQGSLDDSAGKCPEKPDGSAAPDHFVDVNKMVGHP